MTEINKEQLAEWANGYRCDSDMAIKTMAKMLLDFMDRAEKDQVTWPDMPFSFEELEQMHGATFANGYVRGWARKCESVTMKGPLFTHPAKPVCECTSIDYCETHLKAMGAKPVVVLNSSTVLSRRYVVRQIEAAGIAVKDGE